MYYLNEKRGEPWACLVNHYTPGVANDKIHEPHSLMTYMYKNRKKGSPLSYIR